MGNVVVQDDFIEEFWLCSCCKTVCPGVSGTEGASLTCTNCGHKKEKSDPWVPNPNPESAQSLSGKEEVYARQGLTITCPSCKGESRSGSLTCVICGESLGVDLHGVSFHSSWPEERTTPPCDIPLVIPTPLATPRPAAKSKAVGKHQGKTVAVTTWLDHAATLGLWLTLLTIVFGGVWFLMWFTTDHTTIVRVEQTRWTRRQILHEMHDYQGEGWQKTSALTRDVFSWDSCSQRQNGTISCLPYQCNPRVVEDTTRCTGGGFRPCRCSQVSEAYNCRDVVDRSRCSTSVQSRGNGSARRVTSCATRSGCDHRMVPRCESCAIPRVCQTKTVFTTCYHQCPRMETWCRYRYHQWDVTQDQTATGNDHNLRWPGLVASGFQQRLESTQSYVVSFRGVTEVDRTWTKTVTEGDFAHYIIGDRWVAQWSRGGSFLPLHIQPQTDGGR